MGSRIRTQAEYISGRPAVAFPAFLLAAAGGAGGGAAVPCKKDFEGFEWDDDETIDTAALTAEREGAEEEEAGEEEEEEAGEEEEEGAGEEEEEEADKRSAKKRRVYEIIPAAAYVPTYTRTFFVLGHGVTHITDKRYMKTAVITDAKYCRPPFLNSVLNCSAVAGTRLNHSFIKYLLEFLKYIRDSSFETLQRVFPPLHITGDGIPAPIAENEAELKALYSTTFVTARSETATTLSADPDMAKGLTPTLSINCIGPGSPPLGAGNAPEGTVTRTIKVTMTGFEKKDIPEVKEMIGFYELIAGGHRKIQCFREGFKLDTDEIVQQIMEGWIWKPDSGEPCYDIRIVFAHCGKFTSTNPAINAQLKNGTIPYGIGLPDNTIIHKRGALYKLLTSYWDLRVGGGGGKGGSRKRKTSKQQRRRRGRYLKYSRKTRV